MTSLTSLLVLGFLLGMRHATDADHVVAVSTIVGRDRTLRGAARIGSLWGAGHTVTILLVGGAIILFGLAIPARLGLALELIVGVMLVVLGAWSLAAGRRAHGDAHAAVARADVNLGANRGYALFRPLLVGVVHGLAGSAAIALLVLGTIRDPLAAVAYLAVFGGGTVAGMVLITLVLAIPLAAACRTFSRAGRWLGVTAGLASVALGLFLVYRIGFVDGLFTADPRWTPG